MTTGERKFWRHWLTCIKCEALRASRLCLVGSMLYFGSRAYLTDGSPGTPQVKDYETE